MFEKPLRNLLKKIRFEANPVLIRNQDRNVEQSTGLPAPSVDLKPFKDLYDLIKTGDPMLDQHRALAAELPYWLRLPLEAWPEEFKTCHWIWTGATSQPRTGNVKVLKRELGKVYIRRTRPRPVLAAYGALQNPTHMLWELQHGPLVKNEPRMTRETLKHNEDLWPDRLCLNPLRWVKVLADTADAQHSPGSLAASGSGLELTGGNGSPTSEERRSVSWGTLVPPKLSSTLSVVTLKDLKCPRFT
jgi:hypothetical protein